MTRSDDGLTVLTGEDDDDDDGLTSTSVGLPIYTLYTSSPTELSFNSMNYWGQFTSPKGQ